MKSEWKETCNVQSPAPSSRKLKRPMIDPLATWRDHEEDESQAEIRNCIRHAQTYHSSRYNGVERAATLQGDASKDNDPADSPQQRIQGYLERGMNAHEEGTEWQAAVSCKGIAHARAGAHDGEHDTQEREYEQTDTPDLAFGSLRENLQYGAPFGRDETVYVVDAEEETAEKDEAGDHAYRDAVKHDFGALALWVGYFLNHVGSCVEA
ncbi:hypothetical protein E4U59_002983 [Claviceps monticola]|nr:hypothetical protein E4U59_002983 [Claviceps monticola]